MSNIEHPDEYAEQLILTGEGMDYVYEMNRALADGEIVSMHGDRLTDILQRYPHQWLNDYEFWQNE